MGNQTHSQVLDNEIYGNMVFDVETFQCLYLAVEWEIHSNMMSSLPHISDHVLGH